MEQLDLVSTIKQQSQSRSSSDQDQPIPVATANSPTPLPIDLGHITLRDQSSSDATKAKGSDRRANYSLLPDDRGKL